MINKHPYEAPEAERIDVSIERGFLQDTNNPGSTENSSFGDTANRKSADDVWHWM